ncbi:homeobox-containing protein, putative, partial [Plasmodium yoelii yoelii]
MSYNTVKRTYECLYTHQKTQKNKKWKDGYCEILISYGVTKIYLLNSNRVCVESFISNITDFGSIEEEIELSTNLVQFVDIYNYVESEITNEIINDESRKRGSEFSKEHDNTHNKKIKKKHETINFNKNYQIEREEILRPKEILVPSKRIDKYAHTNKKFEVPRKIELANDKSEKREKNELENMHNKIMENVETQFSNINKESYSSLDKKNMISITYTTIHLFNKKNTTKWYDGYIVNKENEIELYNFLEEKLFVKKKENITYDEYMSFGTYIVYNDFLNKSSSGSNNILETSNFVKKNKFNKNLHNILKCGISKNSSINVKKNDEKEFKEKNEYYKNNEDNLGIKNRIFSNPRKRNFVFSKENNNYDNIIYEEKNQNNLENFSEKYNEQIKDSSINKKNGSIHITNKNECELYFYTNYDCDKDEKKKNTKMVFFSGNRENCNKYEEIVNIAQVVSKNHFSHVNVFNNSMKVKLNGGLINYGNKDRNIENDNKSEQLDNINRLSSSLENTKCSDNPKKDYSNTNSEKYNDGYEKNTFNLVSSNYNENESGKNERGKNERGKNNNPVLTKKDTSLHVLETKTALETDKKLANLISEQNLYCDIYKINNMFSFSSNNNSFCINDSEHINRNNLFLPVYITIPKKKEDIKNKLNELPYFKIPNFFVNKLEYILCFMNATLFQIYYEITNKFIYIYDNLIYALKDNIYKNSNLKSVNQNINTKNKNLDPVGKMAGISASTTATTSSTTTTSSNITSSNLMGDYKKKSYKNNAEDNYILLLENVELVYSLQDGNSNRYSKG